MEGESKKPVWFEEKRSLCPKARKRRGEGNREAASVPESKKEDNRGYRKKMFIKEMNPTFLIPTKKSQSNYYALGWKHCLY